MTRRRGAAAGRRRGGRPGQDDSGRRPLREVAAVVALSLSFIAVFAFAYSREPSAPTRYGALFARNEPYDSPAPAWTAQRMGAPIGKAAPKPGEALRCNRVRVVDGDTLRCGETRIRLASIDAPELPGHCRPGRQCTPGDPYASTGNLERLVAKQSVTCRPVEMDRYGRTVAYCAAGGRDLSCAQIAAAAAVVRYGDPMCDRAGKPHDRRLG